MAIAVRACRPSYLSPAAPARINPRGSQVTLLRSAGAIFHIISRIQTTIDTKSVLMYVYVNVKMCMCKFCK
jgi:hypothetical protein